MKSEASGSVTIRLTRGLLIVARRRGKRLWALPGNQAREVYDASLLKLDAVNIFGVAFRQRYKEGG